MYLKKIFKNDIQYSFNYPNYETELITFLKL